MKGMTDMTVAMIAVIAAGIVILAWWIGIVNAGAKTQDIKLCHNSVIRYGATDVDIPGEDWHLFSIDCPPRVVRIDRDEITVNGKEWPFPLVDGKEYNSKTRLTPAVVNSVAASELASCWYKFAEGQDPFFDHFDFFANDKSYCYPCGEIHFEEAMSGYTPAPLTQFLKQQVSSPFPEKDPPKYSEYLYLSSRECDRSANWFDPAKGCEQSFYDYLSTEGWMTRAIPEIQEGPSTPGGLNKFRINAIPAKPLIDESLALTPGQSYHIIFYKLGAEGEGTSYAPLIIPFDKFYADICENTLGAG